MFREMRRFRQKLSEEECKEILSRGKDGVLALNGDGGYPYAVPLNFVYYNGALYFHCAKEGHKIDALRKDGRASFCVIDKADVIQEKYTTFFRSVIAFGIIGEVDDDSEKYAAIKTLTEKYCPDYIEEIPDEIEKEWGRLNILKMKIEYLSGKQAIELVPKKQ